MPIGLARAGMKGWYSAEANPDDRTKSAVYVILSWTTIRKDMLRVAQVN